MGYSYSAKAGYVLTAIGILVRKANPEITSSNSFPGGFWEYGKEQPDGAITGTVWKTVRIYTPEERVAKAKEMNLERPEWVGDPVVKAGSFRVDPSGKIIRFPLISREIKAKAQSMGVGKYAVRHVGPYVESQEIAWDKANGWNE